MEKFNGLSWRECQYRIENGLIDKEGKVLKCDRCESKEIKEEDEICDYDSQEFVYSMVCESCKKNLAICVNGYTAYSNLDKKYDFWEKE